MKLGDGFKRNVDRQFQEGDYILKKGFGRAVVIIALVVILFGALGLGYKKVYVDANREIFKHSIAYTEEAAQFIAKEYREYNATDDTTDKKAIMQYVANRYPNLSLDDIENKDLKDFYRKCLAGGN